MSDFDWMFRGMACAARDPKGARCHRLINRWFASDHYSKWIFYRILRPYRNNIERAYTP